MSLYGYATQCSVLRQELIDSLSREDVDLLRADCAVLGLTKWIHWRFENQKDTLAYIRATPSQRHQKKKWQNKEYRSRIVLAAISLSTGSCNLLDGVVRHDLSEGISYREMVSKAAYAYLDIACRKIPHWPFEGPDPFLKDPP